LIHVCEFGFPVVIMKVSEAVVCLADAKYSRIFKLKKAESTALPIDATQTMSQSNAELIESLITTKIRIAKSVTLREQSTIATQMSRELIIESRAMREGTCIRQLKFYNSINEFNGPLL